jgi:hypothetical protein
VQLEQIRARRVPVGVVARDVDVRIVQPGGLVPDLINNGVQLDQRLLFGFGGHPVERLDITLQRLFEGVDHLLRATLAFLAQRLLDEHAPSASGS